MATTFTFLYVIVNAFTDSAFGGNPASCSSRFSSPGSLTADSMLLAAPTKTSIAQCFVQLTTLFLSSSIHTEVPDSDENRLPRPYVGACFAGRGKEPCREIQNTRCIPSFVRGRWILGTGTALQAASSTSSRSQ
ncbi:hypothetical protein SCLCIDRAFT_1209358 [Scleroderma citrinum Foug A]|uniref:Secreted protein n=1 Tax=Scleroderma citrinum Foug A TaxID=1036808 RepID=A0A0C3EKS5_9AGAM|nr:hypothetical protein SCLCIDRAFT_1209358 [Scleroderma citrinum Foug A]